MKIQINESGKQKGGSASPQADGLGPDNALGTTRSTRFVI
jgi:hypothetical protein